MKTTIYIDGYNLYYGLVKNTQYKWLDFHQPYFWNPYSDWEHLTSLCLSCFHLYQEMIYLEEISSTIESNLVYSTDKSQKKSILTPILGLL